MGSSRGPRRLCRPVRLRPERLGARPDTAAVSGVSGDPNPSSARAHAVARILAAPLTISKRASAARVRSGTVVSFAVRVTSHSNATVHNVSVCDRLPTGLVHVSGGTRHGTEVCWKIGSLASGSSRTFVVRTRAVASATQVVTNLATVSAPGDATRSARARVVIAAPPTSPPARPPSFTG